MINRFPAARILCVGDMMLDQYIRGRVDRVSPEAPVPVLRVESENVNLGGVGNVVQNAVSLGAKADCVAVVGEDEAGRQITEMLANLTNCDGHLFHASNITTTTKTRGIGGHQQMIRIDRDPEVAVDPKLIERILEKVIELLPSVGALALSDYGKGVLCESLVKRLIVAAKEQNVPVVVDPKGPNYEQYRGTKLITPNLRELSDATGLGLESETQIIQAARLLRSSYAFETVLVTLSDKGMLLVDQEDEIRWIDTVAQSVFDVSGAGDTVVAVMACGLALKEPLFKITQMANQAAGLVVAKAGTVAVTREEMLKVERGSEQNCLVDKLMDLQCLRDCVIRWKRDGLIVGFTNGCFDLIHPGHISLLSRARTLCDRLVVGVNSDESVRRLKGADRPLQNAQARATVLSAMSAVDGLTIFEDDTPITLIRDLQPDLLIKGSDYSVSEVVGADLVKDHGGTVELVPIVQGESTTSIVKRIASGDVSSE